jgi:hypothetical protein
VRRFHREDRREKKRENEQVLSDQNSTLFGCANPSPNSAANAFELLGHLTYSLSMPFLFPWLESLLSPWRPSVQVCKSLPAVKVHLERVDHEGDLETTVLNAQDESHRWVAHPVRAQIRVRTEFLVAFVT